MRKNVTFLFLAACLSLVQAGCANNSQNQETSEEDSVVIESAEILPADTLDVETIGTVVDEMMSTVTIATDGGDTVTYVKGNEFVSDAAIGDKVSVTFDTENEEQEIVNVRKL